MLKKGQTQEEEWQGATLLGKFVTHRSRAQIEKSFVNKGDWDGNKDGESNEERPT